MMVHKGLIITEIVCAIIGAGAAVVTAVDQIKNGDKRAAMTGVAAGQQLADNLDPEYRKSLGKQPLQRISHEDYLKLRKEVGLD